MEQKKDIIQAPDTIPESGENDTEKIVQKIMK